MQPTIKRPKPTIDLVMATGGGDTKVLEPLYDGLVETPLAGLYGFLDFKETEAIEVGLRIARAQGRVPFGQLTSENRYEFFSQVARVGFAVVNKSTAFCRERDSDLSDAVVHRYHQLNPHKGEHFRERLEAIDDDVITDLSVAIATQPHRFVSGREYDYHHKTHDCDLDALARLPFQSRKHDSPEKKATALAKEVARIFREQYSREIPDLSFERSQGILPFGIASNN